VGYLLKAASINKMTHLYGALRSVVARQAKYSSGFLGGTNSCNYNSAIQHAVSTHARLVLYAVNVASPARERA
jgi:hypothetical protein